MELDFDIFSYTFGFNKTNNNCVIINGKYSIIFDNNHYYLRVAKFLENGIQFQTLVRSSNIYDLIAYIDDKISQLRLAHTKKMTKFSHEEI